MVLSSDLTKKVIPILDFLRASPGRERANRGHPAPSFFSVATPWLQAGLVRNDQGHEPTRTGCELQRPPALGEPQASAR